MSPDYLPVIFLSKLSCFSQIFSGHLCSIVRCNTCGNVSTVLDPMSDVSLELPCVDYSIKKKKNRQNRFAIDSSDG